MVNVDEANAKLDEDREGTACVEEYVSVTTAVVNSLERSRQTWQRITSTFIPLLGSS